MLLLFGLLIVVSVLFASAHGSFDSLEPERRPRSAERARERDRLADLLRRRGIAGERVLDAIRAVPRHWFVPDACRAEAYDDVALAVGHGQTISQPYIVALMTEALALAPSARVLEIGTGSGYQAAVLAEIAARVYTIEIVPELAARSHELFARRGYTNIVTRFGDGKSGWPEAAPFDAVIVTAAPEEIPAALFEQLALGGRMCIPVGAVDGDQQLFLLVKQADGSMQTTMLAPVRFVPLTGGTGGSADAI